MHVRLTLFLALALVAGLAVADDLPGVRSDLTAEDLARVRAVTAPTTDFERAENFEAKPAGAATVTKLVNGDIFSFSQANLSFAQEEQFKLGNALFRKVWVSSPSSTQASDGLGPLFNARGCQNCHLKDGRGRPPSGAEGDRGAGMFLRLSVPPATDAEAALIETRAALQIPEPTYGTQLQDFAVPGLPAEGLMRIDYEEQEVVLAGGEVVPLRAPSYAVAAPAYGDRSPDVMLSPRVAPPMIGLGLLEQVPPRILARADPDDADGDGISGRRPGARSRTGAIVLGRFGWKACAPSIRVQSASAFAGDIGISTPLVDTPHGDCTVNQPACLACRPASRSGRISEAPDPVLDLVTFTRRRSACRSGATSTTRRARGKRHFYERPVACHTPKHVTSRRRAQPGAPLPADLAIPTCCCTTWAKGLPTIAPRAMPTATNGARRRLGHRLTRTVSGHTFFLHDGRARSLVEAILWHGGEALAARDAFADLPRAARDDLIAFLESL